MLVKPQPHLEIIAQRPTAKPVGAAASPLLHDLAQEGSFLARCLALINQTDVKTVSFDFFDTLVVRRVPTPVDVFLMLGHRLDAAGLLLGAIEPSVFQGLRMAAESRARQAFGSEVSLAQIYSKLPDIFLNDTCRAQAQDMEVALEHEVLSANPLAAVLLAHAQRLGKRVIVVSDTYLDARFLFAALDRLYGLRPAAVFASSEHGVGKGQGLWPRVIAALRCVPASVAHVGDNYHSDVESATAAGVRSHLLPNGNASSWAQVQRERAQMEDPASCVDAAHGDHGLNAARQRCAALQQVHTHDAFHEYGFATLGPALIGFASWVRSSLAAMRVKRCLCLLREGHLLASLLDNGDDNLQVLQLAVSRRVVMQASLYTADAAELRALAAAREAPEVQQFLALAGLAAGEVPGLDLPLDRQLSDAAELDSLIERIAGNPAVASVVVQRSREVRRGLIAHLLSVLPVERHSTQIETIGMVDIGWNGTIQRVLSALCEREGLPLRFVGMYLMTTEGVEARLFEGHAMYGYLAMNGRPASKYRWLIRSVEILEQACTPPEGSVIGYTPHGMPVTAPNALDERQLDDIARLQAGVRAFQAVSTALQMTGSVWCTGSMRVQLSRILFGALVTPTADESLMFAHWQHDENMSSQRCEPIMASAHARLLGHMTPRQFLDIPMRDVYWPYGMASALAPSLSSAAQWICGVGADAALFEAPASDMVARLHIEAKPGCAPFAPLQVPVHRNSAGLSYLRFTVDRVEDVTSLLLDPVSAGCVLRLDMIRFASERRGGGAVVEKVIVGHQLGAHAAVTGARQLQANTFHCDADVRWTFDANLIGARRRGRLLVEVGYCVMDTRAPALSGSKSVVYNPYATDIASVVDGLALTPGGVAVADAINGLPACAGEAGPAVHTSVAGRPFTLHGWACDSQHTVAPDLVFLRLRDAQGAVRFVRMARSERPDVAQTFRSPALARAGFHGEVDTTHWSPGLYDICVVQVLGLRALESAPLAQLLLIAPADLDMHNEEALECSSSA